jgi:DNA-binding MarR family transcriptional regulator
LSRQTRKAEVREELGNEFRYIQPVFEDMDNVIGEYLQLNRTDLRVLDFASRSGQFLTAGEIARQSGLSTGAVTAVIDRLEKAGWVKRRADPADRRRVLVEIPPEAQERMWEIYRPLKDRGDAMLMGRTLAELEMMRDFLRASRAVTEERIRELRELIRARDEGDAA